AYDVMLHLGTLAAVLIYFAGDWIRIIKKGLLEPKKPGGLLLWQLAAGSVPAGLAGLLLSKQAETVFRSPLWIASNLAVFSVFIYLADRKPAQKNTLESFNFKDALLIGAAQSLALMPGASRSGMTIMAALFAGYSRSDAATISFLLSCPVIFGAGILEFLKLPSGSFNSVFAAGVAASFISGLLAIKFFLLHLKNHDLKPFLVYRLLLAGFIFWKVLSR
ncbi:MAG: hypothetical protein A2X59_04865, partial [Nitrospirae bacterium GWC2_42_7]